MRIPGRTIASGAARVVALAVATFLAIIYLKLGYFVLFLLPLGGLSAVLLTRRQRKGYSSIRSSLAVFAAYCAAYVLVLSVAVQNRVERRELEWEVLEPVGRTGPEVRLYLAGSDYLFSHSSELATYLRAGPRRTVSVSLPVSRTLGCFQGVGEPSIEGWGVVPMDGYASGADGQSPWPQHWWCP